MEFQALIDRAMSIREMYENKEKQLFGSAWTSEEIALGFVGDVGDLAKLIVAENGKRDVENSHEKLSHELADCLWSVIVLSKLHNVDLEGSFIKVMDELEGYLSK
ncbi:MAG: nucleotide pyrophosphohydrolase [Anaerolineales bacterium]|nr:nucleotide pyrophosphohydrolase [Anaerolineales bacterium]